MFRSIVALLVVSAAIACGTSPAWLTVTAETQSKIETATAVPRQAALPTLRPTARPTVLPKPTYLSGKSGCGHFANVHIDAVNGVLSDAEFRSKIKEVYDNLRFADPALAEKATKLMRSINSESDTVLLGNRIVAVSVRQPFKDLTDACLEVLGHEAAARTATPKPRPTATPKPKPTETLTSQGPCGDEAREYALAMIPLISNVNEASIGISTQFDRASEDPGLLFNPAWRTNVDQYMIELEAAALGMMIKTPPIEMGRMNREFVAYSDSMLEAVSLLRDFLESYDLDVLDEAMFWFEKGTGHMTKAGALATGWGEKCR